MAALISLVINKTIEHTFSASSWQINAIASASQTAGDGFDARVRHGNFLLMGVKEKCADLVFSGIEMGGNSLKQSSQT